MLAGCPLIDDGPFVFTNDGVSAFSMSKPMVALRKKCGFKEHWKPHDLRRTARTLMSRAGVESDHAERCLGHKIGGVRAVYDQHKFYPEMKKAFDALALQIDRIVNPQDNVADLDQARSKRSRKRARAS